MPFLLFPIAGAVAGFATGVFVGDTSKKIAVTAAAAVAGVWAYKNIKAS